MSDFGTISAEGETRTLRFERTLDSEPEEVWAALTEPEQLGSWLARAEVEPGPEGSITLDFGDGGIERCRIETWDPPRVLAYQWNFVGEGPSRVRFELATSDAGTILRLEHTLLDAASAPGYRARQATEPGGTHISTSSRVISTECRRPGTSASRPSSRRTARQPRLSPRRLRLCGRGSRGRRGRAPSGER